jgi:5-formyltetrahydrofolate cyclo-ligase
LLASPHPGTSFYPFEVAAPEPPPQPVPDRDLAEAKARLRASSRAALAAMTSPQRAEASLAIAAALEASPHWRAARCLAAFSPMPSEPDIRPVIDRALARGVRVGLVAIEERHQIVPRQVSVDWRKELVPGPAHPAIEEPNPDLPAIDVAQLDLIIVPGLAFDAAGRRLGRGGGYYDRWLAGIPVAARRVGVLFAAQLTSRVPTRPHDQSMDELVTERGRIDVRRQSSTTMPQSTEEPPMGTPHI